MNNLLIAYFLELQSDGKYKHYVGIFRNILHPQEQIDIALINPDPEFVSETQKIVANMAIAALTKDPTASVRFCSNFEPSLSGGKVRTFWDIKSVISYTEVQRHLHPFLLSVVGDQK